MENYQIYSRLDISKANSNGGNDLKIFVLQQIESSLKNVTLTEKGPSASEVARLNAEKKLFGNQRERIVAEMQRYSASKDPRLRSVAARCLSSRLEFELCTSAFIVMTADISTGVIFPPIVNTILLYFENLFYPPAKTHNTGYLDRKCPLHLGGGVGLARAGLVTPETAPCSALLPLGSVYAWYRGHGDLHHIYIHISTHS